MPDAACHGPNHAAGAAANAARRASQSCARCGASITPAQDARRRITGIWVHETCPP